MEALGLRVIRFVGGGMGEPWSPREKKCESEKGKVKKKLKRKKSNK
jgi:hypothetical protein